MVVEIYGVGCLYFPSVVLEWTEMTAAVDGLAGIKFTAWPYAYTGYTGGYKWETFDATS